MSASSAQSLYSREVLRLAMSLPHDDRLSHFDGSATRRSPICGSEISADVVLTNGEIAAIAMRAKACALGQASAAILRDYAPGHRAGDIQHLMEQVHRALAGKAEMPAGWTMLAYARDYPARHGAILLPFETLIEAMR